MPMSPEDKEELNEQYFIRDGLLNEIRLLQLDREGLPFPKQMFTDLQLNIDHLKELLNTLQDRLNVILDTAPGIYWQEHPKQGINSELKLQNRIDSLPIRQLQRVVYWFETVMCLGSEERLYNLALVKEQKIREIKARQNETSPEAILERIRTGQVSTKFLLELQDLLRKQMEEEKANACRAVESETHSDTGLTIPDISTFLGEHSTESVAAIGEPPSLDEEILRTGSGEGETQQLLGPESMPVLCNGSNSESVRGSDYEPAEPSSSNQSIDAGTQR